MLYEQHTLHMVFTLVRSGSTCLNHFKLIICEDIYRDARGPKTIFELPGMRTNLDI